MKRLFRTGRTTVILLSLAACLARPVRAQTSEPSGDASRPAGLRYAGRPAELAVFPCTPHSLRIVITPTQNGQPASVPDSPVFVPRTWPPTALRWSGGEAGAPDEEKRVGAFTVRIQARPLTLTVSDAKGRPVQTLRFDDDAAGFAFRTGTQPILGLGQGGAQFDRNGKKFPYINGQYTPDRPTIGARIAVPYALGTEGWALLVVSSSGDFDLTNGQGKFQPVANAPAGLDLIVADVRDPQTWFGELMELTGRPVMPPKWALGYMQSHRTLKDAAQILAEADTFRQKKLPCDALIFLGTGFCPAGWNTGHDTLGFNPKVFDRSPAEVIADIHRRNFQFIAHVTPASVTTLKDAQGKIIRLPCDGDRLYGTFQDAPGTTADPAHIVTYWERHRAAFAAGIDGWWPDEGDGFDIESRFARARMYHEGPLSERPDRRPWNLQRNGYLGVARYGCWIWSGDVDSRWSALAAQVPVGINHSLSVSPYWGTDTGGFHPSPELTGELFVRWFQFSTFCPSFRSHGRAWQLRLPWGWSTDQPGPLEGAKPPPPGELPNAQVEPICRQYLELRYRLLPYTYALAREARDTGLPLMRALWLHYPDDVTAAARGDEYLWGRDLLVAPVVERGATSRHVYLPAGIWYDWWTGERIEGGREIVRPVDLTTLPLYARAGAIIPLDPLRQYALEPVSEPTTLRIYPGADGEFALYEDQGDTNDYLKGASATIPVRWNDKARTLTLGARQGSYPGMPTNRIFRVVWTKPGHTENLESTEVHFDGSEVTLRAPQP